MFRILSIIYGGGLSTLGGGSMKYIITIQGALPDSIADRLWQKVEADGQNLTVLERSAYIYGNAEEFIVNRLAKEAAKFGYPVDVERGHSYG